MKKISISIATVAAIFMFAGCSSTGANQAKPNEQSQTLNGSWVSHDRMTAQSDGAVFSSDSNIQFYNDKSMSHDELVTIQSKQGKTLTKFRVQSNYIWSAKDDDLNLNLINCKTSEISKPVGMKAKQVTKFVDSACKYASSSDAIKKKTYKVKIDSTEDKKLKVNKKEYARNEFE